MKMIAIGIFLITFALASGEWNTNDYLKREHSLMKPYTGELTIF